MKIESGLKQVTLPNATESRTARSGTGARVKTEQTQVSLSPHAAQLKELESGMAAIPVVDRARVEIIKEAIASGQYVINTANIAAGLLDSAGELLHVRR